MKMNPQYTKNLIYGIIQDRVAKELNIDPNRINLKYIKELVGKILRIA